MSQMATSKLWGVLAAADQLLRKIHRRTRAHPLPCLTCGNAMWRNEPPHALGVLVPFGTVPRVALALAFCAGCTTDRDERALGMLAVSKLREGVWSDLRLLPTVMSQAGHA